MLEPFSNLKQLRLHVIFSKGVYNSKSLKFINGSQRSLLIFLLSSTELYRAHIHTHPIIAFSKVFSHNAPYLLIAESHKDVKIMASTLAKKLVLYTGSQKELLKLSFSHCLGFTLLIGRT